MNMMRCSWFGRLWIALLGFALVLAMLLPSLPAEAAGARPEQHEGAHGAEHHVPHFEDINWYYGIFGEQEGVTPSLFLRPVGMPVPVAAMLFNTAILFWLLARFGGPLIRSGLTSRKQRVESGIQAAANMKAEAEAQLGHYEGQLARIDQEIERVKKEMREQAEAERKRVLAEAAARRELMERDTKLLLAQELKAAREALFHEVVSGSMRAAEETIKAQLGGADQERLAEELLTSVEGLTSGKGRGPGVAEVVS